MSKTVRKVSPKSPAVKAAPAAKAPPKAKVMEVGERATLLLQTMISLAGPIKVQKAAGRGRPSYIGKDGSRLPSEHGVWTRDFLRVVGKSPDKFGLTPTEAREGLYTWLQARIQEGAVEATLREYTDKSTGEDRIYVGGAVYLPGFGPQTSGAQTDARTEEVLEALPF